MNSLGMDVVGRWSFLFVVMTTALNVRSSTSGGEMEMKRLLARKEIDSHIRRHIIEARSDCPVSWQKLSSTRSLGGRKMPDTNSVAKCLQRCSADEECLGVDVDLRQEPVIRCWEHSHSYDFDKHRTYRVSGFNQYVKEEGC